MVSSRDVIQFEFRRRKGANPRYSLRAFARDLEISSGYLSSLLAGEKQLSPTKAKTIAAKIGLSENETLEWVRQILGIETKDSEIVENILLDRFQVVADWYHLAILELTYVKGFDPNPSWIAQRLGISSVEAQAAVQRLLAVGLLTQQGGKLIKNQKAISIPSQGKNSAMRSFHREMIEKAKNAIENQERLTRDITGITLAIGAEDLPLYIREATKFRKAVAKIADRTKNPQKIYQVNVQIFRLDLEAKASPKSDKISFKSKVQIKE